MRYSDVLQATQYLHCGSRMYCRSATASLESWSQSIGFERTSLASRSPSQCKRQRHFMRRMEITFGGMPYANKWKASGLLLRFGRKTYQSCRQDIKISHVILYLMSRWDKFGRKAQFVVDGHKKKAPAAIIYLSVLSRDSGRIALRIAAFGELDVLTCNIQNTYLT